jgi:broad specificity phosphatase PhoE
MRQAASLALLLEPLRIARIYSSPFVRSMQTARPLAAEQLANPDVMRVEWSNGAFTWNPDFWLPGLEEIKTRHGETPLDKTK